MAEDPRKCETRKSVIDPKTSGVRAVVGVFESGELNGICRNWESEWKRMERILGVHGISDKCCFVAIGDFSL